MATEQDRDFLKQFAGFKPPQSVAELRAPLDAFAVSMTTRVVRACGALAYQ